VHIRYLFKGRPTRSLCYSFAVLLDEGAYVRARVRVRVRISVRLIDIDTAKSSALSTPKLEMLTRLIAPCLIRLLQFGNASFIVNDERPTRYI